MNSSKIFSLYYLFLILIVFFLFSYFFLLIIDFLKIQNGACMYFDIDMYTCNAITLFLVRYKTQHLGAVGLFSWTGISCHLFVNVEHVQGSVTT